MRIRGFYEMDIDDAGLVAQFGDKLPEMTAMIPDGVAKGVALALTNVAHVKDVKVCPIPVMLTKDQLG